MQVTVSPTVGEDGEQLMLSITGACTEGSATTVTVVDPLALPAELVTVSETVLEPAELKIVLYVALLPLQAPPLHE